MGVIAVPINLRFKSAELRNVLQRLKPTLYIGEAELYSEVAPIEPDILSLDARFIVGSATDHQSVQSWSDLFIETDGTPIPRPHDAHIPAVLLTTSGTTGHPKFVTHTAETLSAMMNTWPISR